MKKKYDQEKNREAVRKYRNSPKGRRRNENYRYMRAYGLSLEDYELMVKAQSNLCFICKRPERRAYRGNSFKLVVDHNHTTGQIRNLLCHNCNAALGLLEESPEYMQSMIDYVNLHKRQDYT